ncbi:MAG: hypothetical protein SNJ75_08815, partial [Gemmataceae bacterium]
SRGYIRTYVTLEGTGLALLFVCVWFWLGVLFDWGLFKLLGVDIVQHWPWAFRLVVLVGLSGLLVTMLLFTIVFRLFVQFNDRSMAKVLEHRFPELLGDKLLTAVELNDPAEAAKLGYSPAMVRQTIAEAAEQVEKVPLQQAFNWKRLRDRGIWVGLLSLGAYLFVGSAVTGISALAQSDPKRRVGFADLNETASLWFERNILLQNTIWPRRSHLELIDYPEGQRVPRKSTPQALRVRAWKYVVAAPEEREGWRQLTWADLKKNSWIAGDVKELPADWNAPDTLTVDQVELRLSSFAPRATVPPDARDEDDNPLQTTDRWYLRLPGDQSLYRPLNWSDLTPEKLGGLAVPAIPGDWDPKGRIAAGLGALVPNPLGGVALPLLGPKAVSLTVGEIETKLKEAPEGAKGLEDIRQVFYRLERLSEIGETLEKLDEQATNRSNRRKLRKLTIPSKVTLRYWSISRTNDVTFAPLADNEFAANFGEIEEDVTFVVRGEDYSTAPRVIKVVERPQLEKLESQEERPAYLYYRPGINTPPNVEDIAGKRQVFAPLPVSISGEQTTLEPVIGTSLTLIGTTTKKLIQVVIEAEEKDRRRLVAGPIQFQPQSNEFRCTFANIRQEQKFTFRFTDVDNVTAERKVLIAPRADLPPVVRDFNPDEALRRDKVGYLITASARLPFKARISDDYGIGRLSYGCRVIPSDFLSDQKVLSLEAVAAVPLTTSPIASLGHALPVLLYQQKKMAAAAGNDALEEQFVAVAEFLRQARNNRHSDASLEFLTIETFKTRLTTPQRDPYRQLFKSFVLTPDNWTEQDEDGGTNPARWVSPADTEKAPLGSDLGIWQLGYRVKDQFLPLKESDITKPQKRFNVEIRLVAEDTFLEGEIDPKTKKPIPHVTASSETFTFIVVPENELLAKIGEEEEQKYRDLQKAFKPLPENLDRLRDIAFDLSGKVDDKLLDAFQARCEALSEVLLTSQQDTRAVSQAYERIVREMRLNQVRDDLQSKVYKNIARPLQIITETNFSNTLRAVNTLQAKLAARDTPAAERSRAADEAKKELNDLVSALNNVLAAMEGINTINKLIEELARIEKQEEDLERVISEVRKRRIKELLGDD